MEMQQVVVLVLAAVTLSAMFGGPVAAVIGFFLIRRSERKPWLVRPSSKPETRKKW